MVEKEVRIYCIQLDETVDNCDGNIWLLDFKFQIEHFIREVQGKLEMAVGGGLNCFCSAQTAC